MILQVNIQNRWQVLSRAALRDDLYHQHRLLTRDVLLHTDSTQQSASRVEQWLAKNSDTITRCRQILGDLKNSGKADFAMLPVAMREIRGMSSNDPSLTVATTTPAKKAKSKKEKNS